MRGALVAVVAIGLGACKSPSSSAAPTFQIVTETAVVRAGDRLPATSPIFDGRVVTLRGVRGETLAFVGVFAGEARPRRVEIAFAADSGDVAITPRIIEMVPVVEPSSALFGPSRGAGSYPDRVVDYNAGTPATQILFEVTIGAKARPGNRQVAIHIAGHDLELRLEVMPYSIAVRRAPLVWAWYDAGDLDGQADELAHQAIFLDHGVLLATDPAPDQLEASRPLMVPSALYWPVRVRADDPDVLATNARRVIDFFEPMAATPFTIPIDEPATDEARRRVVANGAVIRAAGGGAGKLLHTVTDKRRPIYGDSVDVFISPANISDAGPAPALRWTYNGRPPRAGNMTIDSRGGTLRSWGWIAFRYQVELWYAWHALYYTDRYNGATEVTSFETSMVTFDQRRRGGDKSGDHGNGDGLLMYPGKKPSLRLKALRRGLQDRLLLAKLVACGGEALATSIARATIPRALADADAGAAALWPADERGWELARAAVLDGIAGHCPRE